MSETPAAVRASFRAQADQLSMRVRNLMDIDAACRLIAERTADMVADQHGDMPGLGRAVISAAYAVDVSVAYLERTTGMDMGIAGYLNLLASVGQVLAEREAKP